MRDDIKYPAYFQLAAQPEDRRAAKGLLQRALRPWAPDYHRYWDEGWGWSAQFTFDATEEEFAAAKRAVRELALAEGWTGPPCDALLYRR